MNLFRRTLICISATALTATTVVSGAGPASAAHVTCGQTILVSTTLDSDVGPCSEGLTIGADNVTLDLNGFTLRGTPTAGEGPGVLIAGRTGVTVTNGTITEFDSGVAIEGGSGNTVTRTYLRGNRGTGDYGEGVLVFNSTGNTITFNKIENNGPYSGVSLLVAENNLVQDNEIVNNNMSTTNTSGIRLENIGRVASNGNTIRRNVVQGSALDGIQLFAGASRNTVATNYVIGNNRDGITAFAGSTGNVIEGNQVHNNGFGPIPGNGIYIRSAAGNFAAPANNIIRRNTSTGNAVLDLRDGTPNCGTNVWSANTGNTGTPPCVFNP
ncbi:MAG TPA: right-handed parallel beta-helix repeat-containing protein [Acidimicrobiales bacterium]|nr:right-handed parallel beta-helix repeat-containing protein [Acidimicrobiales bacterium]